jgi:hypothetical protein
MMKMSETHLEGGEAGGDGVNGHVTQVAGQLDAGAVDEVVQAGKLKGREGQGS